MQNFRWYIFAAPESCLYCIFQILYPLINFDYIYTELVKLKILYLDHIEKLGLSSHVICECQAALQICFTTSISLLTGSG